MAAGPGSPWGMGWAAGEAGCIQDGGRCFPSPLRAPRHLVRILGCCAEPSCRGGRQQRGLAAPSPSLRLRGEVGWDLVGLGGRVVGRGLPPCARSPAGWAPRPSTISFMDRDTGVLKSVSRGHTARKWQSLGPAPAAVPQERCGFRGHARALRSAGVGDLRVCSLGFPSLLQ